MHAAGPGLRCLFSSFLFFSFLWTPGLPAGPQHQHFWSADPWDNLFGAYHTSIPSRFSGLSVCWKASLVNTDKGSDTQHNLQISANVSDKTTPPYRFPRSFPMRYRLTSSRPTGVHQARKKIWLHIIMPSPLLFFLLPPAHTMCYAAGTGPHRGESPQLSAQDNSTN
eukprot:1151457-Pelagomonas_calceolata.AAC.5